MAMLASSAGDGAAVSDVNIVLTVIFSDFIMVLVRPEWKN